MFPPRPSLPGAMTIKKISTRGAGEYEPRREVAGPRLCPVVRMWCREARVPLSQRVPLLTRAPVLRGTFSNAVNAAQCESCR